MISTYGYIRLLATLVTPGRKVSMSMSDHHTCRRLTLDPGRGVISSDTLQIDDIEPFLNEHAHRNPELVSVTVALDDPSAAQYDELSDLHLSPSGESISHDRDTPHRFPQVLHTADDTNGASRRDDYYVTSSHSNGDNSRADDPGLAS